MNIVIVGAGSIGCYLAKIFSQEAYNIILIDKDAEKLSVLARDLDIATRIGDGTDWELLEDLVEFEPDLFVALTQQDETNLVSCTIAKQLGFPRTVARIRKSKYFMKSRLNFEQLFYVDYLIGPEKLTADAISNMIFFPEAIAVENFAHGQVQLRTVKIPPLWKKHNIALKKRKELEIPDDVMVGLIRRFSTKKKGLSQSEHIVFPHGNDVLNPGDEVTFIGQTEKIHEIHKKFYVSPKQSKSALILGGSLTSVYLTRLLENNGIKVTIFEKERSQCAYLSEILPEATIIHRDGLDFPYLKSEKIENFDVFVACTSSDEVNFLAGCMAKNQGCHRVILSLSDTNYSPLTTQLGITQIASARIHTANRILSIAREKSIASMVSMYNNQAEVMEVKVGNSSKITGIPIKYLGPLLPKEMLIVVIQSRGRVFMADGSRVLSPGDTVVIICSPKHLDDLRALF
jgi:trk system potassium uptake protein TrkA